MNIKIHSGARLGNLLIQIRNAIHIALYYNYNIILPTHIFLNTTYLVINNSITIKDKQLTDHSNFFYQDRIINIDKSLFLLNKDRVRAIMKSIYVFKNTYNLGSNDLVIHVRSGDIFTEEFPNKHYVPPPLSYYKNIIEQNYFDNIYLIAEDTHNPCITRLLELYPKIIFKVQTLDEDINMILASKNIIISIGTFIPQLLELSNNIENIYKPNYSPYNKTGCKLHITNLSEYQKIIFPWKNTQYQKQIMLNYNIN